MNETSSRVVIGMDPHKRSATIEVIDKREKILAKGRYGTDTDGYQQMLATGRQFRDLHGSKLVMLATSQARELPAYQASECGNSA